MQHEPMTQDDIEEVIAILDSGWPSKPLGELAAGLWGAELSRYSLPDVLRVLNTLMRTEKWRPSLAQILKPLAPPSQIKSAYAAFETVCNQIPKRVREVSALEQRAVERLGGWSALGSWPIADRHWYSKAFKEVYDDLATGVRDDELRSIGAGWQRALGPDLRGTE